MQSIEVKNQLISTIALIDDEDKILIGKRPIGKTFENLWEFPGGKVRNNESLEQGIVREAKEEINIDISKACIAPIGFSSFSYSHLHVVLMLYISRKWKGEILPREGNKLKWIRKSELKGLKMPEANKSLIPFILDLI